MQTFGVKICLVIFLFTFHASKSHESDGSSHSHSNEVSSSESQKMLPGLSPEVLAMLNKFRGNGPPRMKRSDDENTDTEVMMALGHGNNKIPDHIQAKVNLLRSKEKDDKKKDD